MVARNRIPTQDKAEILKRHLVDEVPVSDLCDEYDIQPSNFYSRQRKLFENAADALEPQGRAKRQKKVDRRRFPPPPDSCRSLNRGQESEKNGIRKLAIPSLRFRRSPRLRNTKYIR